MNPARGVVRRSWSLTTVHGETLSLNHLLRQPVADSQLDHDKWTDLNAPAARQRVAFEEVVKGRMNCFVRAGHQDRVPFSCWVSLKQHPCYMCTAMKINECVLQDTPGDHNKVWKWWEDFVSIFVCLFLSSENMSDLMDEVLTGGQFMDSCQTDVHFSQQIVILHWCHVRAICKNFRW